MSRRTSLRLRRGLPIWLSETGAPKPPRYPRLRGRHEAEVVIIGAGMTGSAIATTFASAGVATAVVDAARVGRGSTAASTALLLQEPDRGLLELEASYGTRTATRMWTLAHEAARALVDTLRRLRIDCDLVARETIYYTTHAETLAVLQREYAYRCRHGFEGEWLTPGAIRRRTGMTARGAILTTGNAQLNPYRACQGLIAAAVQAGAAVFERSPVRRVRRIGGGVRVSTAAGTIDARQAIVATGYATARFRPLAGRFGMHHTYVLATRPIEPRLRRELGLGEVLLWDTERPYHYARWTADHRLLVGGGDHPVRPGSRRPGVFERSTRQLREHFEGLFPTLADVGIDYAWEGLFALTPDSFPYIGRHRRYPGHLFALGFGGNGLTFGFLAARLLLERWQGIRSPDQRLFEFSRLRR
jgi:glycine/D-amino acid oxidase-like deaminating enzyme